MCAGKHNMGVLHRHTQRVQVLDCLICIYEQTLHLESRFHSWNSVTVDFESENSELLRIPEHDNTCKNGTHVNKLMFTAVAHTGTDSKISFDCTEAKVYYGDTSTEHIDPVNMKVFAWTRVSSYEID